MNLVATIDHGHPTVVVISGDLDLASGPTLEGVLALPNLRRDPNLVLDLTGVTFMDCAGLGILIGARKRIARRGGNARLGPSSAAVKRLTALTGTADLLT
jgi:anti-sigma B factor antagonist